MVALSIRTDFAEVESSLARLPVDLQERVMARTVNRTVEQARTAMQRQITSEFNLKAGYVRERLSIKRARFVRGRLELDAELIGGNGIKRAANVIAFGARPGQRGVSVLIKKKGGRKEIGGSFIANKGRTVFRRTGKTRLPIEPVQTIDVGQMFNAKRINSVVVSLIRDRLPVVFEREAQYALARWGKR
jgi:Prophage minor tail protein Z (GPZ)